MGREVEEAGAPKGEAPNAPPELLFPLFPPNPAEPPGLLGAPKPEPDAGALDAPPEPGCWPKEDPKDDPPDGGLKP